MLREYQGKTILIDCAGNFDSSYRNSFLDTLQAPNQEVHTEYIIQEPVQAQYPNLKFKFMLEVKQLILASMIKYKDRPKLTFENFMCSFNGSEHIGRQFLVSHLKKLCWFHPSTCSKNFVYSLSTLDGNIERLSSNPKLHTKFFDLQDESFAQSMFSFGHNRFDHAVNIHALDKVIASCFVHVVSETDATGYYPFVTEKFIYSVVTKGLWLAYAQPLWHQHVNHCLGFRHYTAIFDYQFDAILCPVQRLIALSDMLAKFSRLDKLDWHDLYELEKHTIEFNFDHYFSQDYLKYLAKYA